MNTYKILIIEDDPVIKNELKVLLSGNGYTVVTVEDFPFAVQIVKAENPHLILLDIRLPWESSFSICSKIRAFSEVPIVFVTSSKIEYNGEFVELTKNGLRCHYFCGFLCVEDNGLGISESDLPRIFEKGFTGENGRNAAQNATGIGLYLCKKLCDKLGIGIAAASSGNPR